MKIAVKLRANRGKNGKIRDCWTEINQICIRCSRIIAIEHFESGFTISQSVVER